MLTALWNLLTACLPPSHGLAKLDYPLLLTPILSKPLMQELTSIFILSSLSLVDSETAFLSLHFLLPMTCSTLRERYHGTLLLELDYDFLYVFFFLGSSDCAGFFC